MENMEDLLRLLGIDSSMFPEHGFKVGDRVRMVNVAEHTFAYTPQLMQNGEEGTVIREYKFNGLMPVFEVRPDSGKTIMVEDEELDRVPFGDAIDFSSVIKIEG